MNCAIPGPMTGVGGLPPKNLGECFEVNFFQPEVCGQ